MGGTIYSIKACLSQYKEKMICIGTGISLIILLPYLHLGVLYQKFNASKKGVDRGRCRCDCWDTYFKGPYQQPRDVGYKHVYFNITENSFRIWTITVIYLIALYETTRRLSSLCMNGNIRWSMVLLFASVCYSHYYAWWSMFNYYNDDYYFQWSHQMFFSVTELASTIIVLYLCDLKLPCTPVLLLAIMSIAVLHIAASGADQFIVNIFKREGQLHQVTRDLGFMFGDLLHIVVPFWELVQFSSRSRIPLRHSLTLKELGLAGCSILLLLTYSRYL